jgi:hypothetical protein
VGQFVYLAVTGVLALVFRASFVVLGMCAAREKLPLDLTKLPSPEYWLSPEHRPELNALVAELMYEIGAGVERHRHRFRADQFQRAPCSVIGAM